MSIVKLEKLTLYAGDDADERLSDLCRHHEKKAHKAVDPLFAQIIHHDFFKAHAPALFPATGRAPQFDITVTFDRILVQTLNDKGEADGTEQAIALTDGSDEAEELAEITKNIINNCDRIYQRCQARQRRSEEDTSSLDSGRASSRRSSRRHARSGSFSDTDSEDGLDRKLDRLQGEFKALLAERSPRSSSRSRHSSNRDLEKRIDRLSKLIHELRDTSPARGRRGSFSSTSSGDSDPESTSSSSSSSTRTTRASTDRKVTGASMRTPLYTSQGDSTHITQLRSQLDQARADNTNLQTELAQARQTPTHKFSTAELRLCIQVAHSFATARETTLLEDPSAASGETDPIAAESPLYLSFMALPPAIRNEIFFHLYLIKHTTPPTPIDVGEQCFFNRSPYGCTHEERALAIQNFILQNVSQYFDLASSPTSQAEAMDLFNALPAAEQAGVFHHIWQNRCNAGAISRDDDKPGYGEYTFKGEHDHSSTPVEKSAAVSSYLLDKVSSRQKARAVFTSPHQVTAQVGMLVQRIRELEAENRRLKERISELERDLQRSLARIQELEDALARAERGSPATTSSTTASNSSSSTPPSIGPILERVRSMHGPLRIPVASGASLTVTEESRLEAFRRNQLFFTAITDIALKTNTAQTEVDSLQVELDPSKIPGNQLPARLSVPGDKTKALSSTTQVKDHFLYKMLQETHSTIRKNYKDRAKKHGAWPEEFGRIETYLAEFNGKQNKDLRELQALLEQLESMESTNTGKEQTEKTIQKQAIALQRKFIKELLTSFPNIAADLAAYQLLLASYRQEAEGRKELLDFKFVRLEKTLKESYTTLAAIFESIQLEERDIGVNGKVPLRKKSSD